MPCTASVVGAVAFDRSGMVLRQSAQSREAQEGTSSARSTSRGKRTGFKLMRFRSAARWRFARPG